MHSSCAFLNMSLALYTFGDSVLDCARYNPQGVAPAPLLVRNNDVLFPSFRGKDLHAHGIKVSLTHRASDGATTASLPAQAAGLDWTAGGVALVTGGLPTTTVCHRSMPLLALLYNCLPLCFM